MTLIYHGCLPMVVLLGPSPPPYTFVTGNLNLLPKNWSKSVVHSHDLFEDALKRPITTIPLPATTTPHNGGLPPPNYPTPLPMTTLSSPLHAPNVRGKIWWNVANSGMVGGQKWRPWKLNETWRRLSGISGRKLTSNGKLWICKSTVGTLYDGYLCKVPLPRAPWIQSPGHVTCAAVTECDKHDTCYLQVPRIPTLSDLIRSHAGYSRSTMLQLAPVWLM